MNLRFSSLTLRRVGVYEELSLLRCLPRLKRDWNTGIRWISSTTPRTRASRASRDLLTLRPSEMVSSGQSVYDFSNFKNARFRTYTSENTPDSESLNSQITYHQIRSQGGRVSFPPGTKGLVYYHHEPNRPPVSGELRIRICDDPSSFSLGKDLTLPNSDQTWKVPLYAIIKGTYYAGIRYLLTKENLLPAQILEDLDRQRPHLPKNPAHRARILYDITEPFEIDLALRQCKITLVTQKSTQRFLIFPFSYWSARTEGDCCPFIGKIRVHLVPSPLPEASTRPLYNLRITDILTPLQPGDTDHYSRIRPPKVGELAAWKSPSGEFVPWTCDLSESEDPRHVRRILNRVGSF